MSGVFIMELTELIKQRRDSHPARDQALKHLGAIRRLDGNRLSNLDRLLAEAKQASDQLDPQNATDAAVHQWLQHYIRELETAQDERKLSFGADLAAHLDALGWKLRGQYPKLTAGLFTFALDFQRGRCKIWYGPEQELLDECVLDADKVDSAVRQQRDHLGSGLEPSVFLSMLQRAYHHAQLESAAAPLPLLRLLPFLALEVQSPKFKEDPRKEHYKQYTRADFSYDLYQLNKITSGVRLTIATRMQTNRRGDFLWVPTREDVGSGNYFASVELKEGKS